ncbi:MAG TPA: hypothetical protein VIJ55_15605 [Acetobacteraceae bacterium]
MPALLLTVRGKILIAFVLMSAIAACLGLVALRGIGAAGGLVVRTFDRSLMSIDYARAAAADFAQMQAALARREGAHDQRVQQDLDRQTDTLAAMLGEDLGIAASGPSRRVPSRPGGRRAKWSAPGRKRVDACSTEPRLILPGGNSTTPPMR